MRYWLRCHQNWRLCGIFVAFANTPSFYHHDSTDLPPLCRSTLPSIISLLARQRMPFISRNASSNTPTATDEVASPPLPFLTTLNMHTAFVTATPLSASLRARPLRCPHGPAAPSAARAARRSGAAFLVAAAVRGSSTNPYRIAVLPGDGAGPEAAAVTKEVLGGLADSCDLHFEFTTGLYGEDALEKAGSLVPKETLELCRKSDAVLRSYQGSARSGVGSGSAHRQLLDELGLFAQLRPVVVYPQLVDASTLRGDVVDGVDVMLVREVSAGALASVDAKSSAVDDGLEARSDVSYTREEVDRIASVALQVAERRSGRVLNVDKADAMLVSRFWRTKLHSYFAEAASGNDGISLEDMYVDDFVREVILRPTDFDTVVTSNLFGDIVAEVMAALSGPARVAPSVWVSRDGLGVYGPADIYNPSAYPSAASTAGFSSAGLPHPSSAASSSPSPIAMIRSASMMLRYALEEPAAADLIQQALRKALEDVSAVDAPNMDNRPVVNSAEFGQTVLRSLQLMRQFEQMCPPDVCGE